MSRLRQFRSGSKPPALGIRAAGRLNAPAFFVVEETPFHAQRTVTPPSLGWLAGCVLKNERDFVGQLNTIAQPEVNINLWDLEDVLVLPQYRHHAQIDFPIPVARRAGVVGEQRRSALRAGNRWNGEKTNGARKVREPATPRATRSANRAVGSSKCGILWRDGRK